MYSDFAPASSNEQLIANVQEIWNGLDQEYARKLCESVESLLEKVIAADGDVVQ